MPILTSPYFVGEVHGSQRPLREVLEEHYPAIWCIKIVGEFDLCIQCLEISYEIQERIGE